MGNIGREREHEIEIVPDEAPVEEPVAPEPAMPEPAEPEREKTPA